MFCYIKVLSTLLCLMFLYQIGIECTGNVHCPAGFKRRYNTNVCDQCPFGQFKSESGNALTCDVCSKCGKGSEILIKCTSTSDTICKCKGGFTAIDQKKNEICFCKKGFGENKQGICIECGHGYFSDKGDSTCQKWRDCKSGILTPGTSTSDAVCINVTEKLAKVTTETTTHDTTLISTTKITPAATLRTTTSSPDTKADRFYGLWLVIVSVGILLLVALLYKKCQITYCIHNFKKADLRKESKCKTPIEESGKCDSLLV